MSVELIAAGQDTPALQTGDILLVHRHTAIGRAIYVRQRLYYPRRYARWEHVACVRDSHTLVEALTRGVVKTPIEKYRNVEYLAVRTGMTGYDQRQAAAFLDACVGQQYGWWTDLALAVPTPPTEAFGVVHYGTSICSGLAAQMLVRGWEIFFQDPAVMVPAALAEHYDVVGGRP